MTKVAPTPKLVGSVLKSTLTSLQLAHKQLGSAADLLTKMPHRTPNVTRRIDKLVKLSNEVGSLMGRVVMDAHTASWCTDEIHEAIAKVDNVARSKLLR